MSNACYFCAILTKIAVVSAYYSKKYEIHEMILVGVALIKADGQTCRR